MPWLHLINRRCCALRAPTLNMPAQLHISENLSGFPLQLPAEHPCLSSLSSFFSLFCFIENHTELSSADTKSNTKKSHTKFQVFFKESKKSQEMNRKAVNTKRDSPSHTELKIQALLSSFLLYIFVLENLHPAQLSCHNIQHEKKHTSFKL